MNGHVARQTLRGVGCAVATVALLVAAITAPSHATSDGTRGPSDDEPAASVPGGPPAPTLLQRGSAASKQHERTAGLGWQEGPI